MFKIIEGDFKNQTYGDETYLSNWPMLYILENGKQAYIGESNHVKNRMSQHHSSIDKQIFDKVHFIYSSKFNQSVTFDYVYCCAIEAQSSDHIENGSRKDNI